MSRSIMAGSTAPKRGQRVKILSCQYNLAEHVGQVGTVVSVRPGQLSIFVNHGLCRAIEVGPPGSDDAAGEDEQTLGDSR
jgi:hypothetical protein